MVNAAQPRDSWNTPLHIEPAPWGEADARLPRAQRGSGWRIQQPRRSCCLYRSSLRKAGCQPGSRGTLEIHLEHNRGPMNQRAEVSGTVLDPTAPSFPAQPSPCSRSPRPTPAPRMPRPMANLILRLFLRAAIGWKSHRLDSSTSASGFTLQERDRALLSATLDVGSVTEAVVVEPAPPPMALMSRSGGRRDGRHSRGLAGGRRATAARWKKQTSLPSP